MTRFASFSLTLPLLHFFFLPLLPAIAAFIFASLDFWTTLAAPMPPTLRWPPADQRLHRPATEPKWLE